jgi:putative ABC transport system permease protein
LSLATTLIPAMHALRMHRLRTGLALLGICFGVAAVVVVVTLGAVTQAKLKSEIKLLGANVLVVLPGAARNKGAWQGSAPTITEADAEAIASEGIGIEAAAPAIRGMVQVVYGNRNRATTLRGVTPALFAARPWPVNMGRPLTDDDVRHSRKVALLAHAVARDLFGNGDPTGMIIRIKQMPFTIIGVLEEKGHSLGGEDLDDQVLVPLATARKRVLGFFRGHPTAVGGLTLRVADGESMARATEDVRRILRERHRLRPTAPDDFVIRDLAAAQRAQSRSTWWTIVMFAGAAAVSLVIGGVGIMNVMLVSVSERRQEIALRMAVGARRRDIGRQFLAEAGLLALLGSGAGVILGIFGAMALGEGSTVFGRETSLAILAAVVAASAITVGSGLYPSRKAARMEPAEALVQI